MIYQRKKPGFTIAKPGATVAKTGFAPLNQVLLFNITAKMQASHRYVLKS